LLKEAAGYSGLATARSMRYRSSRRRPRVSGS
jgi:hypothetical protein